MSEERMTERSFELSLRPYANGSSGGIPGVPEVDPSLRARVDNILEGSLVWDNHGCMPLRPGDHAFLPQLERYSRNGANVIALNIGFGSLTLDQHVRQLADFRSWIGNHSDRFVLADSITAIEQAQLDNRLAIFFDVEGMAPLDAGDHGVLALLRELGVGWMLVAYNEANAAGGGCRSDDGGLTAHGRSLLREMKAVGMLVCCSHTGLRTAREVIEHADNPVIFSHSNPDAVYSHYRNIPDELIRAIASVNGVIGINGVGEFLGPGDDYSELMARHIDHAVQLVGPEHVGLGLDYVFDRQELIDYLNSMPETFGEAPDYDALLRFVPPEIYPSLVSRLLDFGYPDVAIQSILGGNWRRVAKEVWRE